MAHLEDLLQLIDTSIHELDRSLGIRGCGLALSGACNPGYKGSRDAETPESLTYRVLFLPMVRLLGYGEPVYDGNLRRVPGTAMAIVPLNRPMDMALRQMIDHMRVSDDVMGVVTDGLMWIVVEHGPMGPKVHDVHDLRPYYIRALDICRFRCDYEMDFGPARDFLTGLEKR